MASIETAVKKYERKMSRAGEKWKSKIDKAVNSGAFAKGIENFIGGPVNPVIVENWKNGVESVSASDFQSAVAGKGEKWKRKYLSAMAA